MDLIINASITLLAALLVVRLLLDRSRSYIALLLYALFDFASSIAEEIVLRSKGRGGPLYTNLYWTNELLLDLLLFFMVVVLIRRVAEMPALRKAASNILVFVLGASAILPFVYGHHLTSSLQGHTILSSPWFSVAGQVLNFGGAIMNLVLWTALLASKRRDPRLLAVSAGLGLIVTGQALYYGMRILFSPPSATLRSFEDGLAAVTHIAGLALCCWAFRPAGNRSPTEEMSSAQAKNR